MPQGKKRQYRPNWRKFTTSSVQLALNLFLLFPPSLKFYKLLNDLFFISTNVLCICLLLCLELTKDGLGSVKEMNRSPRIDISLLLLMINDPLDFQNFDSKWWMGLKIPNWGNDNKTWAELHEIQASYSWSKIWVSVHCRNE